MTASVKQTRIEALLPQTGEAHINIRLGGVESNEPTNFASSC